MIKYYDREILELRQKTLALGDILSPIAQFSWRIKKAKERNKGEDYEEVSARLYEQTLILGDFLQTMEENLPKMRKAYEDNYNFVNLVMREGEEEEDEK